MEQPTPHPTSILQPLPHARRQFVFLSLLTLFILAVPVFVFYATGYRYNIFAPNASITATGGLYISILNEDGELYLNEEPVNNVRIFRNASYLQNLLPGVQRIHVQSPGLHTWVKELPVYPHIVTEAEAFLLPVVPQVRLITEFVLPTGNPVLISTTTTATSTLPFASSSLPLYATTSRATTTYARNTEFDYVVQLFGTTTESEATLLGRVVGEVQSAFSFDTVPDEATTTATSSLATTTRVRSDVQLYEKEGGVYAKYLGYERDIPYYFCIPRNVVASTTELYGAQVMTGVNAALDERADANYLAPETVTETFSRVCRDEIKIDTQGKEVLYFEFFPGSSDLIVLHLSDGVYVVEIDDRAWQNAQKVYPASARKVIIDSDRIYIRDEKMYLELLTELLPE